MWVSCTEIHPLHSISRVSSILYPVNKVFNLFVGL
ncbi:hypothetical protein [Escherichia phage pEC-M2929-1AR.1]|nr:hypothetical protein [Escherichia phage pEC-M2929-1AR.1]